MKNIKVLVLTSDKPRHRYLCQTIAEKMNLVGVISEKKGAYYKSQTETSQYVAEHFKNLTFYEEKVFGQPVMPGVEHHIVEKNGINEKDVVDWAKHKAPDVIVLFGTGILKNIWLDSFQNRIINIHLGLSPYYRGSATLFWPFYNNELDKVGATIHLAVQKVDAGALLEQVTADIDSTSNYYEITNGLIKKTIDRISGVVEEYLSGALQPHGQDLSIGAVYKKADFTEEAMLKGLANGRVKLVKDV